MSSYELLVILKVMTKPELTTALKRTAETLWSNGSVLRQIENLGTRTLPYRMRAHGKNYTKGSYFLYQFEAAPASIPHFKEYYERDVDIIRPMITRRDAFTPVDCTIQEETQSPAYRKDVAKLLQEGAKNKKQLFKPYVLEIDTKSF